LHHQLRPSDDLEAVVDAATLREIARLGDRIGFARVDDVCRPERYLSRLSGVFDRLADLS